MHPRKPNEKGSGRLEKKELLLFSAQPRAPRRGPSLRRVLRVTQIPPPRPIFQAPTSPGVYWRGDVRWIKYPPAIQRLLERHETQSAGFVNIGPVRTSRGDYMVDLQNNVQVSTRGPSPSSTSATSTHDSKKDKAPAEVSCFGIVWNKRKKDEKNATRTATKERTGADDARASTGKTFGFGAVAFMATYAAAAHVFSRVRFGSRVSAPPSTSVTSATPAQYLPCEMFQGTRPGYFFCLGAQGSGYYVDRVAQSSAATLVSSSAKATFRPPIRRTPAPILPSWTLDFFENLWQTAPDCKNDITPAEDPAALLALMDSIKDLYLRNVRHFLEEGKKLHVRHGKKRPTLAFRDNLWDLQCAQLRKFLELAKKHGASESDPRVLFGYHGTSVENADKIFLEGFSPACRRSSGAGAYFSGELEYSAGYAQQRGPGDILLVVLLLDGHRSRSGGPVLPVCDKKPSINGQCVFEEKYAMPVARLRGF